MKKTVMKILREEYGVRHIDGRHLSNYKFSTLCAYIDQLNKERDEENNKKKNNIERSRANGASY